MGRHLSLRYGQVILVSGYPVLTAVNWSQHWCAICVQYQSSCAPKLARKCEIEHWFPCGADGRAGGQCAVTCLANFLGWVDILTDGAPQARFARQSAAIIFLITLPIPFGFFFSRKNSLAWGVKCEKFNVVALIPIFASINEFIIAKEQSIWLYQILLANISWQCFASYIGLVTFFMYLETTHLSVFHRCSTRSSYNIQ